MIVECKPNDAPKNSAPSSANALTEHFKLRYEAEKSFFAGNDFFVGAKLLPLMHKEVNLLYVYNVVENFKPDIAFVFGSWIIKQPLLSLIPKGRFINLHLGLSPYYRGSGTNFWPFINKELEYVGSTILHIDEGIDTGDIIAHVRPNIEIGDDVHTVGCKVIKESVSCLMQIIDLIKQGKELNRIKQWAIPNERYYKESDFNEEILSQYYKNLKDGFIENYLKNPHTDIKLISL